MINICVDQIIVLPTMLNMPKFYPFLIGGGDNRKTQNFKTPTRAIMNNADTRLLTPKSTPYLKIYPPPTNSVKKITFYKNQPF